MDFTKINRVAVFKNAVMIDEKSIYIEYCREYINNGKKAN